MGAHQGADIYFKHYFLLHYLNKTKNGYRILFDIIKVKFSFTSLKNSFSTCYSLSHSVYACDILTQSPYLWTFLVSRKRFRQARNWFLGSLKCLQIRALDKQDNYYPQIPHTQITCVILLKFTVWNNDLFNVHVCTVQYSLHKQNSWTYHFVGVSELILRVLRLEVSVWIS